MLQQPYDLRLLQQAWAQPSLAVAACCVDQHGSVARANVHARGPILYQPCCADQVAKQRAVAEVGLVGREAWITISVTSGHFPPVFCIRGTHVLDTVHQQPLRERGLLRVLRVGHIFQPDSLFPAHVSGIEVGEVEAVQVPCICARLRHSLSGPRWLAITKEAN